MSLKSTFATTLAALTLATSALADIEVQDPYARSSNAMAGAAFMVIRNLGDVDDRLLSVTSDAAQRVELHTHIEDANGVMRMVHVEEGYDLPAGGEITLQRGAEHVMFMGLTAPFEDNDIVTLTLTFEVAGDVEIEVPVDQERTATEFGHSGMDHSDGEHSDKDHSDMDHSSDG